MLNYKVLELVSEEDNMSKKLVLIDGNSIIFRAFFALPLLNNDKGVYTNAVYGFTTMLLRILEEEKPTHMLVAFDAGKTTFRHKTYEEYKGGREKTPPELKEQIPLVKELLDAFHIPHYELDLYEADDIIGTLATDAEKDDYKVKVISGDQDLLQLVSQAVTVDVTRRGITNVESYDPQFMKEKMELNPEQIIDLKALMGDSSDNIPGVPGVGIKTATRLLKEYGTLDQVYENLDKISGKKLKENLTTYKDEAYMSQQLVEINRQSPVEISVDQLSYAGYKDEDVYELFKELEFQTLIDRLDIAGKTDDADLQDIEYTVVSEVTEAMFSGEEALNIESLAENYHQGKIELITVANEANCYVIPVDIALNSDIFKQWLEDPSQQKYVFDAKRTFVFLLREGIHLRGVTFDLLLASYVLNPSDSHHDIPTIARRVANYRVLLDEDVYGKGAKRQLPDEKTFMDHVARKVYLLFALKDHVHELLEDNEQADLLDQLEIPLALILGEMEHTGIKVDVARLNEMGDQLQKRLADIEKAVFELAGETFNLNSPKQLGVILFEKLQLPVVRKTKTGYSTAADVLEKLQGKHEIIEHILHYRQLGKLQSTYIEGLLKVVDGQTDKIHTRFNQALTQTGRLSSLEPNLQNIPIRLEEGRKIREAFTANKEDWIIFAADYSQIELRVLAHIANDEKLIDAFRNDADIHTQTAAEVFDVAYDAVTPEMRDQAKAVNFGIIYGMSDYGLSQNLGITRKEARQFIDRYFSIYPGVKQYMDDIVQQAKHEGYVTTLMKRRRYLPEITSRNFNQRSFAERTAMNTPIQGSAADIIKKAMIDLHTTLKEEALQARMLLQVHDELILELPENELATIQTIVPRVMESTVSLNVPLKVDMSHGKSWYETG